ncbi:MAG: ATP-binding protein [Kiritimatiellaeota bacterium]|nr:ATP-binding protein [Kiritimatiellota bacterium]
MQQLIQRKRLLSKVESCLAEAPATVLLGARQTGKTTMARMIAAKRDKVHYFDLERAKARDALAATAELTLGACHGLVVIDEIQRMPQLFEVLRPLCDAPGRDATYLLLGSASPDIVKGVSETLAGRAYFVDVSGFALDEVGAEQQDRLWLQGGFPRAFQAATPPAAWRWIEQFRRTFLERDLPQLAVRVPPETLRRFWTMLAHYHGQTWNSAELARSMAINPHAVTHYRDLLAGTYMLRVLPPWHENLKKRQIKAPKVYIRDSGMLHDLLEIGSMAALRSHPRYGASWEGFAIEQVLARFGDKDAYFWATQRGAELDLLLFRRGQRWGFEFKCSDAPSMTKSMHMALADLQLEHLWAVYPGQDRYVLHKRAEALPLMDLEKAFAAVFPEGSE